MQPFDLQETMRLFRLLYVAALLGLAACACDGKPKVTGVVVSDDRQPEKDKYAPYVEGNKRIMQWEKEEMELFIKRYGWPMQRTGTGLYVEILNPGRGLTFKDGQEISMEYRTFLLSGEMVGSSETDGIRTFTVGQSQEIEALHEAARMLKHGAKARLVIPSYLAYGVAGDGRHIKGRLPIAMLVEVI